MAKSLCDIIIDDKYIDSVRFEDIKSKYSITRNLSYNVLYQYILDKYNIDDRDRIELIFRDVLPNVEIFNPNKETHLSAYIIGNMIADLKYYKENKTSFLLSFGVSSKDRPLLQLIRDTISPESSITSHYESLFYNGSKRQYSKSCLNFTFIKPSIISEYLDYYNIIPEQLRTGFETWPNFQEKHQWSALCGFLDGDGYITKDCRRNQVYFRLGFSSGGNNILEHINSKFFVNKGKISHPKENTWELNINKFELVYKFLYNIYQNTSNFCLQRKYNRFLELQKKLGKSND